MDWSKAAIDGEWSMLTGHATSWKVEARFIQDGEYLYGPAAKSTILPINVDDKSRRQTDLDSAHIPVCIETGIIPDG